MSTFYHYGVDEEGVQYAVPFLQPPFVAHEGAYFEATRRTSDAPLPCISQPFLLDSRGPTPVVFGEHYFPTLLPGFPHWHPELNAIGQGNREALQTTPLVAREGAHFEDTRRTSDAPLSCISQPVWLNGRGPTPVASPEHSSPARVPEIKDWHPDLEAIGQETREALQTKGIGHYLASLQQHNFNLSPQRWSEFPDNDPQGVDTYGRYRPIKLKGRESMDESWLLKCDRCGTLCDLDFNVVEEDGDKTAERVFCVLPYIHCPLQSPSQCYSKSRREWITVQAKLINVYRLRLWRRLERFLLREPAAKISADAFEENGLDPTTREIFNAYRGLRVFWIRLLVARKETPQLFADPGDDEYIDSLPLWGDLMTDVTLTQKDLLTEQHMNFLYGISSRGADYLYRWQSEWEREVLWLNTYAGMSRHRYLTSRYTQSWRKLAKKIGRGLEHLVDAEENLVNTEEQSIVKVEAYRAARMEARALFRQLHSWLMCADDSSSSARQVRR